MAFTNKKAAQFIDFILGNKFETPVIISVLSGVATVNKTGHGLNPGEFAQIFFAVPDFFLLSIDGICCSFENSHDEAGVIDL